MPGSLGPDGGHDLPQHTLQQYIDTALSADPLAVERCVQIITSTDFTEKLSRIGQESDIPVMAINGDKDLGNPTEASLVKIKELIPRARTKEYQNGAHGRCSLVTPKAVIGAQLTFAGLQITHPEELLKDLLDFTSLLK